MLRAAFLLATALRADAGAPVAAGGDPRPGTPAAIAGAPAAPSAGARLRAAARRLDGGGNDASWIAGYSLRFVRCATSSEYRGTYFGGEEGGGGGQDGGYGYGNGYDYQQRLVHFQLCPTGSCDSSCR